MVTTREQEAVKRKSAPLSVNLRISSSTSPVTPDSTSEGVIDLTSEGDSKTVSMRKEPPKTPSRKKKNDPAVTMSRKITDFFKK